jgi:hypothetical protein
LKKLQLALGEVYLALSEERPALLKMPLGQKQSAFLKIMPGQIIY